MELLQYYLPLCWFKNHPLQLPSSESFFRNNLIFYYAIWVIVQANMISPFEAFIEVTIGVLLTLLFVAIVLSLNRSMHNYIQVMSAVLVSANLFAILSVPVIAWLTITYHWLSYTVLVLLIFWAFAVITYIMKKVLSIDIYASLVVAFVYFVSTYGAAYTFTLLF